MYGYPSCSGTDRPLLLGLLLLLKRRGRAGYRAARRASRFGFQSDLSGRITVSWSGSGVQKEEKKLVHSLTGDRDLWRACGNIL